MRNTARLFATLALAAVALFAVAPSLWQLRLPQVPPWVLGAILVAAIQLAYVAWILAVPDWSTAWLAMAIFALSAAAYAVPMVAAALTPADQAVLLGLTEVRRVARLWCGAVVLLCGLMSYACGRVSYRWRKAAAARV